MGIQINGNTNNINAGIGSLSIEDLNELDIVGVATAANFKTGVSNLHNVGLTLSGGQIDVGSNIKIGTAGVVTATTFVGNLTGNVSGTVSGRAGSADKLTSSSTFRITGDVSAADLVFDGQTGGSLKTFTTSISNAFVTSKPNVQESQGDDEFLINRITGDTGLKKINRQN